MSNKSATNEDQDRKPGLGGRQGHNEHQPEERRGQLASEARTRSADTPVLTNMAIARNRNTGIDR
jgi:hypothetical protein